MTTRTILTRTVLLVGTLAASSSIARGGDPADVGQWNPAPGPAEWPIEAVHASVVPSGKVAVWSESASAGLEARLWDPDDGSLTAIPTTAVLYCGGHSHLDNGGLLVVGGGFSPDHAVDQASIYSESGLTLWTSVQPMLFARWYPTCTTLPDGRVLVIAGLKDAGEIEPTPEIYNADTDTWQALPTMPAHVEARFQETYPFMFVLPDGDVFYAGGYTESDTYRLSLPLGTWQEEGSNASPGGFGAAVMYEPGKILKCGGGEDLNYAPNNITALIDFDDARPAWSSPASAELNYARKHHNLVLLPDGKILCSGGDIFESPGGEVLEAEMFDPATGAWTEMATATFARNHHSTAVLLPDGRVLAVGGDNPPNADEKKPEVYSPPYLFRGARPLIRSAPSLIYYANQFQVSLEQIGAQAPIIGKVSLVRLSATTHGFDQNQRFIELDFVQPSTFLLQVTAPANGNLAPPGYYMLFVLRQGTGVPSTAAIVRLGNQFGG